MSLRDDIAQIIFGEDNDQIAWDASGDIRQHYLNDADKIIAKCDAHYKQKYIALIEKKKAGINHRCCPLCAEKWEALDDILKAIEEGK